jgi:hypothetical protein
MTTHHVAANRFSTFSTAGALEMRDRAKSHQRKDRIEQSDVNIFETFMILVPVTLQQQYKCYRVLSSCAVQPPAELQGAVRAYGALLAAMAWRAAARGRRAALGAALFLLSDAALAYSLFAGPFPYKQVRTASHSLGTDASCPHNMSVHVVIYP